MNSLDELYQEMIIDHGIHPRNFGEMAAPHRSNEGFNPLCGDRITLYLQMQNDIIKDVSFSGAGCAISMASASLMTDAIKGKTVEQAEILFEHFHELLTDTSEPHEQLGKLAVLSGVKQYPMRIKCATLAWHTLAAAMHNDPATVTTEE